MPHCNKNLPRNINFIIFCCVRNRIFSHFLNLKCFYILEHFNLTFLQKDSYKQDNFGFDIKNQVTRNKLLLFFRSILMAKEKKFNFFAYLWPAPAFLSILYSEEGISFFFSQLLTSFINWFKVCDGVIVGVWNSSVSHKVRQTSSKRFVFVTVKCHPRVGCTIARSKKLCQTQLFWNTELQSLSSGSYFVL